MLVGSSIVGVAIQEWTELDNGEGIDLIAGGNGRHSRTDGKTNVGVKDDWKIMDKQSDASLETWSLGIYLSTEANGFEE